MESVLQLSETEDTNYPDYFKVFLDNCLEKFPNSFVANDYLFAALYFIILECGFTPFEVYEKIPHACTESFDIRKLRFIKSYGSEHMKIMQYNGEEYCIYTIPLKLGNYRCECELQGVPSAVHSNYLIVNFFMKGYQIVKSLCLNTEDYTEINYGPLKHKYVLKNLRELTLLARDKLCNTIKETIMLEEGQGCCPHLLRLPEDIQIKIIHFMASNPAYIQYLASTCTYFYNIITNDFKLWESLCMSEYSGKAIYDALRIALEVPNKDDCNIFKRIFLELKAREVKSYRFW